MLTVGALARALGARADGDLSLPIRGAAEPAAAGPEDLAVALAPGWAAALGRGRARAALLWPEADRQALGLEAAIYAPRGRLAMARLTQILDRDETEPGIHPTAVVHPAARLADDVAVGPLAVIGAGAEIGAGCRIGPQATLAPGVRLGAGSVVGAGVRIGRRVRIGPRAILQPNAVVGADGFSFVTATPAHVEVARRSLGRGPVIVPEDPTWHRIHSLGGVEIGADVEIGAGTAIDSGTLRPTRIGDGTKIDNLVQVAHNVVIGRHCLLCGQSGIAGSSVLGERVVLGGQSGVADNLSLGDDVVVAGGAGVLSDVPAGRVVMGTPAIRMDAHLESYKALRRLPRLLARLGEGLGPGRGGGVSKGAASD
jgi:UDP-3-O-[3-hydroxymyristoyl] glucosamine N-acyltransferase